jgi:hypothetical protein
MKGPQRIVSGEQTGVDRAGLYAATEAVLPVGGYVPKGRLAEDAQIPDKYPMTGTGQYLIDYALLSKGILIHKILQFLSAVVING